MGSTCASVHVLWHRPPGDAARLIARAYGRLGYQRVKKPPPEGGKRVVVVARPGQRYLSIYDSTNADLDSGELKQLALAASKLLKTGAVFTSLYDSDSYEFVVFGNGRQVDLLMSDVETYSGPIRRLSDKARVAQWARIFGATLTIDQIRHAATQRGAFANEPLAELCGLIGVPGDRPQAHYADFADDKENVAAELYFSKQPTVDAPAADGRIALADYFDPDNSRKLLVYPAAWPMPIGQEEVLTWLVLSEGAGFIGGALSVEVAGPAGLAMPKGFLNGCKFHNGQIVGSYQAPTKGATREDLAAYLESKRFFLHPAGPASPGLSRYRAEYPNLRVPPMTPSRRRRYCWSCNFT